MRTFCNIEHFNLYFVSVVSQTKATDSTQTVTEVMTEPGTVNPDVDISSLPVYEEEILEYESKLTVEGKTNP